MTMTKILTTVTAKIGASRKSWYLKNSKFLDHYKPHEGGSECRMSTQKIWQCPVLACNFEWGSVGCRNFPLHGSHYNKEFWNLRSQLFLDASVLAGMAVKTRLFFEDWVYFWQKAGKALKKSRKTGKARKVLRKTGKKHMCRKMPFLSRGNPEKLENMAETGKYNLKFADTGKVLLEVAESWKSPKRQWKVVETGKSAKKPWKAGKRLFFLRKAGNRPPIHAPLFWVTQFTYHGNLSPLGVFHHHNVHCKSLFHQSNCVEATCVKCRTHSQLQFRLNYQQSSRRRYLGGPAFYIY